MAIQGCTCGGGLTNPRPFESCIYCAHKHLSSALALSQFIVDPKDILTLRVASQVQLAAFHFNVNYLSQYNKSIFIVDKILNFQPYKTDLREIAESTWNLRTEMLNKAEINEDIMKKQLHGLKYACLQVSNAIELTKYESAYKAINFSYAMGQLVLAHWTLQEIDENLAKRAREFYLNVEINSLNIDEIEKFKSNLWQRYIG